jgi:hypothetical protein
MATYFDASVFSAAPKAVDGSRAVLKAWADAWAAAGWTTKVLNETHARAHPDYQTLRNIFYAMPTVSLNKAYEMSCFVRHLAMAAAGGGWMSDFDTVRG